MRNTNKSMMDAVRTEAFSNKWLTKDLQSRANRWTERWNKSNFSSLSRSSIQWKSTLIRTCELFSQLIQLIRNGNATKSNDHLAWRCVGHGEISEDKEMSIIWRVRRDRKKKHWRSFLFHRSKRMKSQTKKISTTILPRKGSVGVGSEAKWSWGFSLITNAVAFVI